MRLRTRTMIYAVLIGAMFFYTVGCLAVGVAEEFTVGYVALVLVGAVLNIALTFALIQDDIKTQKLYEGWRLWRKRNYDPRYLDIARTSTKTAEEMVDDDND